MFTNAALNPVIYGVTNESFRKAFQSTPISKWLFSKDSIAGRNLDEAERRVWNLQPRDACLNNQIKFDKAYRNKTDVYNISSPGLYKATDEMCQKEESTLHI